jgi:hypothetical protein
MMWAINLVGGYSVVVASSLRAGSSKARVCTDRGFGGQAVQVSVSWWGLPEAKATDKGGAAHCILASVLGVLEARLTPCQTLGV